MLKLRKNLHFKTLLSILFCIVMMFTMNACLNQNQTQTQNKNKSIVLATTTSTQDSGLLDYLLPKFEKDTGIKVKVLAKGTGEAMEVAKRGDADALLVHAKEQELQFVKEGYGTERLEVMYNDFVIVGPKDDPAKLKEKAPKDAVAAFKLISSSNSPFISRGDKSGTNTKENSIWKEAGITPSGTWYISAGKGMGAVLQMADEKKAYTLTDRATYLSMKNKLNLTIVTEKGSKLLNQYSLIRLNPKKNKIKTEESNEFIKWMLSSKGQKLIGEYGKDKYGISLFVPNAKK
ncbi:substrate-binding domain-containing protein [Clostridium ljungdahlii]|uniref:PBP superfamily domain protein n=1 Tax=Clostridium ljungdahlii TaxID=1538 RepID=A0A162KRE5_9CLOT|nr:substrate-binding domain-containing protein [Clostridium ljungdahlii]OAA82936.1 PBP superfamily domain protein [Clostridium ljungdahlii]